MQHSAGRDRSQAPHQPAPTGRKPKSPPTGCLGPVHLRRSLRICSSQSTRPEPPPTPTSTRRRPDDYRTRARACNIIHPGTHQTQPSANNDQTYSNKQPARHPTPTITEDQTRTPRTQPPATTQARNPQRTMSRNTSTRLHWKCCPRTQSLFNDRTQVCSEVERLSSAR